MLHLTVVRHAQASFHGPTYDALSDLGRAQARALGQYWAQSDTRFDRVYVGPLSRHADTLVEIAHGYCGRGLDLPPAETTPLLDEHQGVRMVARCLGREAGEEAAMQVGWKKDPGERDRMRREYLRQLRLTLLRWAAGELDLPDFETFEEFKARAGAAVEFMTQSPSSRVLAVSSGGLAAMIAGGVLGVANATVVELSLLQRNCATTEILCSRTRRSLLSLNALCGPVEQLGETFV
jgi:broad specificity phosphatase PhoE